MWQDRDTSMRPHRPGRPSELMNSFALCTLEPTRIDSISFWIVSSGAILGQPSELPSRDDSRSTIRPGYTRAGMCTGNTAGPCPFVTVSMHFGGRASLQLSHGLTSPHLHSRPRRIYIYISGSPFPCRLHPHRNIPPRIGPRTPSCSTKRQGGRFGTRAIHHPPLARTENPFTDPTGTTDGSVLAHFNYPAEGWLAHAVALGRRQSLICCWIEPRFCSSGVNKKQELGWKFWSWIL